MDSKDNKVLEINIMYQVSNYLADSLGASYFVAREYRGEGHFIYDIAVFHDKKIVAIVECKRNAKEFINSYRLNNWLNKMFDLKEVGQFVVTDGRSWFVFFKGDYTPREYRAEDVVSIIMNAFIDIGERPSFEETQSVIMQECKVKRLVTRFRGFIDNLTANDFIYSDETAMFSLNSDKEDAFFRTLLGTLKGNDNVCRYTTLNSLFKLLEEGKQNMCNIICMNDRGEYSYADKYLNGKDTVLGSKDFDELDSCFILSLLEEPKEDDLTMWRLYGDNAKGVCISYKVRRAKVSGQFFLSKVSYGQKNGSHPSLEFIKSLRSNLSVNGWTFRFSRWNIWKHFFKSYHFAIENEVRLMYYDSPKSRKGPKDYMWIKNPESQIVSKMQMFEWKDFPLMLRSALVGPNCMEAGLLARQFESLARDKMPGVKCSFGYSRIEDYR